MKYIAFIILNIILITQTSFAFSPQYGISSGLVGYWSMDSRMNNWTSGTTGTSFDSSGNNGTGTFTNMTKSFSATRGKIREGIRFDGTDDYINIPNNSSINTPTQMTISIWVNSALSSPYSFASKANPYPDGWIFYWDSGDPLRKLKFDVGWDVADGAWKSDVSAFSMANKWTMFTVTYDGSSTANDPVFYVNGQPTGNVNEVLTPAGARVSDSSASLMIGRFSGGFYVNGYQDEFRFYNRVLSANEIRALYRLGLTGNGRL